jgi:hypothetical protein
VNEGVQWKRGRKTKAKKNKVRCWACAYEPVRTSNESHVETLIYLFAKNTTKLFRCVRVECWKIRFSFVFVWNPRKCRKKFSNIFSSSDAVVLFSRSPERTRVKARVIESFFFVVWSDKGQLIGQVLQLQCPKVRLMLVKFTFLPNSA